MKLFGMSILGGKATEYRVPKGTEANPDPESLRVVDTDRALELLSRLPEVSAALTEYTDFELQMTMGGAVLNDAKILADKRAAVVSALATAGYRLEEKPSKYGDHADESVEELARAATRASETKLAA